MNNENDYLGTGKQQNNIISYIGTGMLIREGMELEVFYVHTERPNQGLW